MWPWEHLAVGYLATSLLVRAAGRRPGDGQAIAVLVGTQLPDLIDKPLAWGFGVFASGTSVAHSVFVAVPLTLAVGVGARRSGHARVGVGFAVGYLSHLPGDVFYGVITTGDPPAVEAVLWPLVDGGVPSESTSLIAETLSYAAQYRAFLSQPEAVTYLLFEASLLTSAFALWVVDGVPGFAPLVGRPLSRLFSS